ncbi:DNA-binding transcriptional LysR family regulator [Streptomyces calvus]|uniref:LysR family transcriptional regulator n=1 Tax=Streptomyces calvus TaxID=67282 RepID=UPI003517686C
MKLSQCAAFVAVAETESFTRAGLRLGISQSAVSHAVAALEKELGVTLMSRERGGVVLTTEGRRALQHAQGRGPPRRTGGRTGSRGAGR